MAGHLEVWRGRTFALLAASAALTPAAFAVPAAHATFPGDDGRIAFCSNRPAGLGAGDMEIWTMVAGPEMGESYRNVTDTGDGVWDCAPAWSPNGRKIAFTRNKDIGNTAGRYNDDIYTISADGSGVKRLTRKSASEADPAWSPSGRKVVYTRDSDLWAMKADGSHQHALTEHTPEAESGVMWSPLGDRIAFSRNGDIWTVNTHGGDPQQLTNSTDNEQDPNWSPDGQRIFYDRTTGPTGTNSADIYTMDADGNNQALLFGTTAGEYAPVLSPEGGFVAYARDSDIYRRDSAGTADSQRDLTFSLDFDAGPDWQPK